MSFHNQFYYIALPSIRHTMIIDSMSYSISNIKNKRLGKNPSLNRCKKQNVYDFILSAMMSSMIADISSMTSVKV